MRIQQCTKQQNLNYEGGNEKKFDITNKKEELIDIVNNNPCLP